MSQPFFDALLHVGRPNLGDHDLFIKKIEGVLENRWLTAGPLGAEFEQRIAEVAGTRFAVATCNATVGLQIAARACGLRPGDEIIVPAFTWVATAHAVDWIGLVPVFCDIDEETGNLDPAQVARLIGPRTKGILGVHVFGVPCDIEGLTRIADEHGIPLIFDAAHGIGSSYRGKPIGGFGSAEVFSFHATKFLNSFEGGAIVTDDEEVAERARAMRNFGIGPDREVGSGGTNGKLTEAAAAMGLVSLASVDHFLAVNQANFDAYVEGLADVPGIRVRPLPLHPEDRCNLQYVVIDIDGEVAGIDRETLAATLLAENVSSRPYFSPGCHQLTPYRERPEVHAPHPLPRAEALAQRVLALPTGTAVTPSDVASICTIIRRTTT
ncbi:DegT/DnrJ/EryC1/StrS family aminotransferase [Streptomyces sp. DSM 44915]|uniref:DegT/DnrJ/EryC1/StrS family aminotransferase n=1 Tax=Streptomyces chisholmiae TaxID=3075540 RepID=A0ABU2JTK3_9ACTN|nr:DegT/DnrJ/EryC1/StrS family aminotransferase [Streptomyces sp. DSM 44915]MDT0268063.1 DegT/DnrJ/EryC1/StrS family aminotransferase [Streptomyces sp. DSM 44915]